VQYVQLIVVEHYVIAVLNLVYVQHVVYLQLNHVVVEENFFVILQQQLFHHPVMMLHEQLIHVIFHEVHLLEKHHLFEV
jgi:hypothetical protein